MKTYIQILLACLLTFTLTAQINVKIGYGTAFVSSKVNNSILQEFNEIKRNMLSDSLSIPFKNLRTIHGIDVGLRLKFNDNGAIELTWQNLTRSREAVGEINNAQLFQQELFYSFNQIYFAYQSQFNGYGMGVGLGYNRITIKDRIANSDFKHTLIEESQLFSRINLSFYFQSNPYVSFAIQPFIQFPLDDINLNPLRKELDLPEDNNALEGFRMIGVSFVFYNGRQ